MMLDYIRGNAQSWGVKIAFGIIILVFVFWGVGRMQDSRATVVATVNGEGILAQDLYREMQRMEENIRASYPNVTSEQIRSLNLQGQAEQSLIVSTLLRQEAKRTGFVVTPLDLRRVIEKNPAFQNEKGEFDSAAYLRVLDLQRIPPGQYESNLRRTLLQQKFYDAVTAASEITEIEARALFDFAQEKRQISYLLFPLDTYLKKVTVGEDEIRAAYESGRASFTVPATCDVDYVLLSPESLAKPDAVKEEEIKAWYEKNTSAALQPERLHLRHILLRLAPDAPESETQKAQKELTDIATKIKKGENFEALAKRYSQDPGTASKGGDLGWVQHGDTVPEFEKAAGALKPGQLSEPVRTEFGLHLIKLEGRETERTRSLDEMRPEIRALLARRTASELLRDVLDHLVEANIIGTPLDQAAKAQGLEVRNTGPSDAAALQTTLGVDAKGAAALLAAPAGTGLDSPLEVTRPDGSGFIVARIRAATPEKLRDFAEVKDEIVAGLTRKHAAALALADAEKVRREIVDGQLPAAERGRVVQAAPVGRMEPVADLGPNADMERAVFGAAGGTWLEGAFSVDKGAVLLHLDKCMPPRDESWRAVSEPFMASLAQNRREQSFQSFVNLLAEKARIERKKIDLNAAF